MNPSSCAEPAQIVGSGAGFIPPKPALFPSLPTHQPAPKFLLRSSHNALFLQMMLTRASVPSAQQSAETSVSDLHYELQIAFSTLTPIKIAGLICLYLLLITGGVLCKSHCKLIVQFRNSLISHSLELHR